MSRWDNFPFNTYTPFDDNLTLLEKVHYLKSLVESLDDLVNANSTALASFENKGISETMIGDKQISTRTIQDGAVGLEQLDPSITSQPNTLIGQQAELASMTQDISDNKNVIHSNNFLLYSSFSGLKGNSLDLYVSYDGVTLNSLNLAKIYTPSYGGQYLRDPSIMWYNGYFYLTFTTTLSTGVGIGITRTKDFKTFDEFTWTAPSGYTNAWAPEWFVDGTNVYIVVSLSDGTTEVDTTGATINYFKQYYIKATNTDLSQFAPPVLVNFSTTTNRIDGSIFKYNGVYYYICKNEHNKTIEQYSLNGSTIEGATFNFLRTINFPVFVEGPSCVQFNGQFYLYADGYDTGTTWFTTSTDMNTWSVANTITQPSNMRTAHFTSINVTDPVAIKALQNYTILSLVEHINTKTTDSMQLKKAYLSDFVNGTTFTPPHFNTMYVVTGADTSITISNIVVPDYNKHMRILLCLQVGGSSTQSITLKNGNNLLLPGDQDFIISVGNNNNEVVFALECLNSDDSKFRLVGAYNPLSNENVDPIRVDLSTLASGGIISSLQVQDAYYYYLGGTTAVTINDMDLSLLSGKRAKFWICMESGSSSCSITINKTSTVLTPADVPYVISVANNNNEVMHEFQKPLKNSNNIRKVAK